MATERFAKALERSGKLSGLEILWKAAVSAAHMIQQMQCQGFGTALETTGSRRRTFQKYLLIVAIAAPLNQAWDSSTEYACQQTNARLRRLGFGWVTKHVEVRCRINHAALAF